MLFKQNNENILLEKKVQQYIFFYILYVGWSVSWYLSWIFKSFSNAAAYATHKIAIFK